MGMTAIKGDGFTMYRLRGVKPSAPPSIKMARFRRAQPKLLALDVMSHSLRLTCGMWLDGEITQAQAIQRLTSEHVQGWIDEEEYKVGLRYMGVAA